MCFFLHVNEHAIDSTTHYSRSQNFFGSTNKWTRMYLCDIKSLIGQHWCETVSVSLFLSVPFSPKIWFNLQPVWICAFVPFLSHQSRALQLSDILLCTLYYDHRNNWAMKRNFNKLHRHFFNIQINKTETDGYRLGHLVSVVLCNKENSLWYFFFFFKRQYTASYLQLIRIVGQSTLNTRWWVNM